MSSAKYEREYDNHTRSCQLFLQFSEVAADPSRLLSFIEQLVNVSSNVNISDDIPQIITFLTNSLSVLNGIDEYQQDTYNVSI